MKFSTVTLFATIIAVAAAQSSSGDGIITISPIPGSTDSASPTESTSPTATGPATTSSTATTTGPPTSSPTKPSGGSALSSTPVKMLLAIGGGAAVLAQFL
ncbi:hypothetical protein BGZ52_004294 [Haplosporangium bisporale]|nr:hypothetical protein BGZ52_004294 [Haplosporangium bisporale]